MTDRTLVRRMLAGEERAFDEFFESCAPGLYRFALARLGRDHDAAEEVVQLTLARALAKLHTYRGEAALFTWLCSVCRNELAALQRRRGCAREVALVEDEPEVRAALESLLGEVGPEQALARRELARLVQVVLDALPPHYANALEWKYVHGLSVKEIAERLSIGPKAAESLLTRARLAFRDGFSAVAPAP